MPGITSVISIILVRRLAGTWSRHGITTGTACRAPTTVGGCCRFSGMPAGPWATTLCLKIRERQPGCRSLRLWI